MENASTVYTFNRFPSRTEAAEFLKSLIESGFLNDNMTENLKEIKTCIENERFGIDLFGAAHANIAPLFIQCRVPDASDSEEYHARFHAHRARVQSICDKYRMVPRKGSVLIDGDCCIEVPDDCSVTKEDVWV